MENQIYTLDQDLANLRKESQQLTKARKDAERKLITEVARIENQNLGQVPPYLILHSTIFRWKISKMIVSNGSKEKPICTIKSDQLVLPMATLEPLAEEV